MSKAQLTWIGPGLRMVAEANEGPAIVLDSHGPPHGTHTGPAPMELFLMGLAGCTGMDVVSILTKKRQKVTGFQIQVEAERAASHPKVYTKIHVIYIVHGEDIKPSAVERAIELSETQYCSAMAMLRASVEITNEYRIVEDKLTPATPGDPAGE
ncbi:MAG: OsmC family protein [Anaerolineae bacterium]|nr:OsmC family protein [Anaerolineae bacterium]